MSNLSGRNNDNRCVCFPSGLLRGDPLPGRDGRPGQEGPSRPSVGPESHLPAGFCPQGPGPDEGQVSGRQ